MGAWADLQALSAGEARGVAAETIPIAAGYKVRIWIDDDGQRLHTERAFVDEDEEAARDAVAAEILGAIRSAS